MKFASTSVAAAAAVALAALASTAGAQAPGAAPPTGAALPGVCVLSNDRMIYGSAVGKFVLSRMEQLTAQASAELNSEGAQIQTEDKALQTQSASLPADQVQQRGALLNQRYQTFQRKVQVRQRELETTKQKALDHIGVIVDPIVRQVFVQRSCSVLLNGAALIYPAPAMDVTDAVIRGLDAKIQQFPFDREHLEQPGAPAS